jgi:hypothetical protein
LQEHREQQVRQTQEMLEVEETQLLATQELRAPLASAAEP